MIDRLPAWPFLLLAMLLIGVALMPVMRVVLNIDDVIGIQPLTMFMLLIGGLMSGLSAMILMVKRQPVITQYTNNANQHTATAVKLHASGLLLFTGIPLMNFLVCYWLWTRHRYQSEYIDAQGKEALNFQITIYLYLLLALFLTLAIIGVFAIPLLLALQLILSLVAVFKTASGQAFRYPTNIPIIQGREKSQTKASA